MADSTSSRDLELDILSKSHGTDASAQESIARLLADRYALSGSQKPFLMLSATERREDEQLAAVTKRQALALRSRQKVEHAAKTLRPEGGPLGHPSGSGKRARSVRPSRLAHARTGLREYIEGAQQAQKRAERQLFQLTHGPTAKGPFVNAQAIARKHGVPSASQFSGLAELWQGYARELLFGSQSGNSNNNNSLQKNVEKSISGPELTQMLVYAGKLAAADMHGARVRVVSAHNPSLVGISGIVIWEAKTNFVIAVAPRGESSSSRSSECQSVATAGKKRKGQEKANTPISADENPGGIEEPKTLGGSARGNMVVTPRYSLKDRIGGLRIVEKRGTIFSVQVDCEGSSNGGSGSVASCPSSSPLEFEIVGSRFIYRTAERAGRKFKPRAVEDLM